MKCTFESKFKVQRHGFNGEWKMKLRRDKADSKKQDQEEKGEKIYSFASDNVNLW